MTGSLLALIALARPEVAIFRSDDLPAYQVPIEAFASALGRPVTLHDFDGDEVIARSVARELRKDPPPLVLALGAEAAWIAVQELPAVPVVHAMVLDPERYGIEGPRVTGVAMALPADLVLSQFKLFFPEIRTLGVLASTPDGMSRVGPAVDAAQKAGFRIIVKTVSSPRDLRRGFAELSDRADALWLLPDPALLSAANFRAIRDLAAQQRMPILAYSEALVRAGALMCVAPDHEEVGRQAAALARKILDAAPYDGLPRPVIPSATRVVLNRATLDGLGLHLDPVMYDFVDEVIEATGPR